MISIEGFFEVRTFFADFLFAQHYVKAFAIVGFQLA
jgi:hypothetical protein